MRPSLLVLLILLVASGPAGAAPGQRYVTEMGRRVLSLCDMVAVGEVTSVNPPFRGVSTARFRVAEHISSLDKRRSLTLIYIEDYLAPDAIKATFESTTVTFEPRRSAGADKILENEESAAGSTPRAATDREVAKPPRTGPAGQGVRLLKGEKGIFFLRKRGASFAIVGFIPERDPLFDRKRTRLRDVLSIEAVSTVDGRVRAAKRYFLRGLGSADLWERGNAAREIEGLSSRYAGGFQPKERRYLAERLYVENNPTIASALERAVRSVAPREALAYAFEAEERERSTYAKALEREEKMIAAVKIPEMRAADLVRLANRYGRAATETLCRYLGDEAAIVRETVAGVLSRQGGPSCRNALRDALAKERDPDAARAMIHTLGVKSDPQAVRLIERRLATPDLERASAQALGRIGTPEAFAALRRYRPQASASVRGYIDVLLKDRKS
ncbi:MAG: HEAT repeat domain-containing protein [Planctomycetota bacterium]